MKRSRIGMVVGCVALTLTLAGSFAGSAFAQDAAGSDEKLVLRVGTTLDLNSDNPFKACCTADYEMLFLNYDLLLSFGQTDLRAAPDLAEGCTSKDNLTWTCTIRDGVKWSDGEPLTARDIKFTYDFILNNPVAGAFYTNYLPYDPTFEAPDDHTLIWKSSEPTFAPIVPPWVPILPEHIWSQYDGQDPKTIKSVSNTPSVGSGPFQLAEWAPGQSFRMVRNENYWGKMPAIDEIDFQVFDNPETMVQALKAGEIDFADRLPADLFTSLEGEPGIATHEAKSDWWPSLAFNFGGQGDDASNLPALGDLRVRQAIAHAIDKQRIVDSVYQGFADPGDTIVRPASAFWHLDIPAADEYAFDPEESRRILDEAGYVDTDGDGVREDPSTGDPLQLDIPVVTSTQGAVDASKLIKPWLEDVGFAVTLQPMTEARVSDVWTSGDFDAYIWYWSGDPDPDFIMSVYTTEQCLSWSDGCYSNPEFDRMYAAQRKIFDIDERKAAIDEMQRFIYNDVPGIALAYPRILQAYRTDRFTGYVASPEGGALLFGYGPFSYVNLKPVAGAAEAKTGGTPIGVWLGFAGLAVVVVALVMGRRRRERAEES